VLLPKLIAKQRERGLSDREFAKLLDVPRSTWQLTRTGRVPLGPKVARGAQRAFDDLAPLATLFLLYGASAFTAPANVLTAAEPIALVAS